MSTAHAQVAPNFAVDACHALEQSLGQELFQLVYINFGGCVSDFSPAGAHSDTVAAAHGCHLLVDRGVFANIGKCIAVFRLPD
jgi:hypothetical protein